jgi:hypothetical protein
MDELHKSPHGIYGSTSSQTRATKAPEIMAMAVHTHSRREIDNYKIGLLTTTAFLSENRWMTVYWSTDGLITFSSILEKRSRED